MNLPEMKIVHGVPPSPPPGQMVALDLEITGGKKERLHRPEGEFAFLSVAYGDGTVYIIDKKEDVQATFDVVATDPLMKLVYHKALFDIRQLSRWATIPRTPVWDTMLMEQNLFGGYYSRMNLAATSARWLGVYMNKKIRETFTDATEMTEEMYEYGALDAYYTLGVAIEQLRYIEQTGTLSEASKVYNRYHWIDEPMIWVVLDMLPATVNVKAWLNLAEKHKAMAAAMKISLDVNYNSPAQVKVRLKKMGFNVASTGQKILEGLKTGATEEEIKFLDGVIKGRSIYKMGSTYGTNWIEKNIEEVNKVYANWNISGATQTGRLSCSNPNLQNIPARRFPIFRTFFTARDDDHILIVSDVSQQEPRITAFLSRDENLKAVFESGEDSHTAVARALFDIPEDEEVLKTDPRRRDAKAINLGMTYGLSEKGLMERTDLDETGAKRVLDKFFAEYPGIDRYIKDKRRDASSRGYVETILGKKCWVNEYFYRWANIAINAPIQGSAAEMMKLAMIILHEMCEHYEVEYPVTMVIHDEMVLDVPKDKAEIYQKMVLEAWRVAGERLIPGIPIVATADIVETWGGVE